MAVRPRGSGYQVDVKVGAKDNPTGEKVRVRATASDETTAYTLEAEIVKAIRKHGAWKPDTATAPSRSQGTLAAALEEAWNCPTGRKRGWKYQRSGKAAYAGAKACIEVLGPERHCATITIKDFDLLTLHFEKLGNATNTINVKIQSFRRVLFYAQRLGWIASRPAWERPSAPPPREFIFSDDLEKEVIHFFKVRHNLMMATVFKLGIETGLRLNELLTSTVGDWDLTEGVVRVRSAVAKSGSLRMVTLTDEAKATIKPLIEGRPHDLKPFRDLKKASVGHWMVMARKHLGYADRKDFCFHATRHTRATRLARQCRDIFVVMAQLGHGQAETSMRYIKLAAVNLDRAT